MEHLVFHIGRLVRKLRFSFVDRLGKILLTHFPRCILPREARIVVNGLEIYYSPQFHNLAYIFQIFCNKYEPFTIELFKKSLKPGMLVVDAGAHLGLYSLLAGQSVLPGGKVFAFEPDPRNLPFLRRNVEHNGLSGCVRIVPKAVSMSNQETSFFLGENPVGSSLFRSGNRLVNAQRISVETVSLDDYFQDNSVSIDVIKLDVEGAEILALRGMERTIRRARRDLIMFVELNPPALRDSGGSADELVELLRTLDFKVMIIDENNRDLVHIGSDVTKSLSKMGKEVVNLYCVRTK